MANLGEALMRAREALARLTLSGPVDRTGENHVQALNALEAEVDELEGELGRASARYRVSVAELSLDDVVEKLSLAVRSSTSNALIWAKRTVIWRPGTSAG